MQFWRRDMKDKLSKIMDYLLILLQGGLSVYILYNSYVFVPLKYFLIILAVLIILFALVGYCLFKQGTKIKNLIGKLISLILSISMCFGSTYISKGVNTLNNITSGNYQTHVVSIIVLKDSSYNDLADLKGKTIGKEDTLSKEYIDTTINYIKENEKVDVAYESESNIESLYGALKDQKVDAIILNEAYRGMLEELDDTFSLNTRTIYQYEIKEELIKENTSVLNQDTFSVYVSGIDTYGEVSTVSRSDMNMVVTVNTKTHQVLLTSIPRDYYVTLASFGAKDKLTHSGIYGINETVSTIENLLGIDIQYYIRVNFSSLVELIDVIGGIDVYSDLTFVPHTNQSLTINEGVNHMDGAMALAFSRERYSYAEGDRHRVKNQQDVLIAVLKKLMTKELMNNYNSVLTALDGTVEMSFTKDDLSKLIQLQLQEMPNWQMMQYSLDGSGAMSTTCYSMPGSNLYVMEPYPETVSTASNYIKEMEAGNEITVN